MKFVSPGRVEILGNHTDHNHGQVLVSAISLATTADVEMSDDGIVRVFSEGHRDIVFDHNDTALIQSEAGKSKAIVKGVIEGFKKNGFKTGAFTARMKSSVPSGAGVSSSASFELMIAQILNNLFNDGKVDRMTCAKIGQYSENVYMGKPSGLLDQAGIAFGGITHIDFKNIDNPTVNTVQLDLKDYKIVITSTGGDHSDLTGDYKAVKDDMNSVAEVFSQRFLSEVDEMEFFGSIHRIQKRVSGRAILRAAHFFDENRRVMRACEAIKENNLNDFFALVRASGDSSYKLLQNCYCPTDTKQRIPLALYLSSRLLSKGAYRVHGGGFEGTILAFVHESEFDAYISTMSDVFGEENVFVSDFSKNGTCRVL